MMITVAVSVRAGPPSAGCTTTERPGPSDASPWTKSTPWRRRFSTALSRHHLHDVVGAPAQALGGDLRRELDADLIGVASLEPGEVERRLPHRLARHGAADHRAARLLGALDHARRACPSTRPGRPPSRPPVHRRARPGRRRRSVLRLRRAVHRLGGGGAAVLAADHGEEPLDRVDRGVGAHRREHLEGVLGARAARRRRPDGSTPCGARRRRCAPAPTGTSESLVPWSTKNGGACGPTWLIGRRLLPASAVVGQRRLEDPLGEEPLDVGAAGAVPVDEVVDAVERHGRRRRTCRRPRSRAGSR